MSASKKFHVAPSNSGKWAVRREGGNRAASVHETKEQAVSSARTIARKEGSELVVHTKDGRISERNSYQVKGGTVVGRDPSPPKDTKR